MLRSLETLEFPTKSPFSPCLADAGMFLETLQGILKLSEFF